MYLRNLLFLLLPIIFITSCNNQSVRKKVFSFNKNKQGVELLENGKPVFFYQEAIKSLDGKYNCTNYIHPLYSLDGVILTEESPADHPHHRGIFWAWHQIYINGQNIGDGWMMDNISQEVNQLNTKTTNESAKLDVNVLWKSPNFNNNSVFIEEKTKITIYKSQTNVRLIDFEIALIALTPGVEIGGSDNEKGYGGFCPRVKLPNDIKFTSNNKEVIPQTLQIKAGSWMDFSGSLGKDGKISGVSILCHPSTPNYPAPWILRAKSSMQNIVFPGQQRVEIPTKEPIVLRYRLVIHNGTALEANIEQLQADYEKLEFMQ